MKSLEEARRQLERGEIKYRRAQRKNTKKWDSLAHMNLIMALENELKIKFTDNEITEMLTFELVKEIIINKKGVKYKD